MLFLFFLLGGESGHEIKQSTILNNKELWGGCGGFCFFIAFQGSFAYGKAISDGSVVGRCHSGVRKFGVTGIWKLMNYL